MARSIRLMQITAVSFFLGFMSMAEAGWVMVEKEGDTSIISNGKLKSSAEGVTWILRRPR